MCLNAAFMLNLLILPLTLQQNKMHNINFILLYVPKEKSMKKGLNGTIPPSPQNERGGLIVLGL
jgi:hypothetical protein